MALKTIELSFGYDRRKSVFEDLTTTVEPGVVTALVGPNGSGKTTLLRLFADLVKPRSGKILLDDEPIGVLDADDRSRRLAYLPARSEVAFPYALRTVVGFGLYAMGRDPGGAAVDEALDRVDLLDRAGDPFGILSSGQQQRATLARVLLQLDAAKSGRLDLEGQYLLADEPTSAMDPKHALEAISQLKRLARSGCGVLVVMHDLPTASRVADHAIVLNERGQVAGVGPAFTALDPGLLEGVFGVGFQRYRYVGTSENQVPEVIVPTALRTRRDDGEPPASGPTPPPGPAPSPASGATGHLPAKAPFAWEQSTPDAPGSERGR